MMAQLFSSMGPPTTRLLVADTTTALLAQASSLFCEENLPIRQFPSSLFLRSLSANFCALNRRYDRNAVRVDNVLGSQVGHLPRKLVEKLAPYSKQSLNALLNLSSKTCHMWFGFSPASDLLDRLQLVNQAVGAWCPITPSFFIICFPRRFDS